MLTFDRVARHAGKAKGAPTAIHGSVDVAQAARVHVREALHTPAIQLELTVGPPDDLYERQAEIRRCPDAWPAPLLHPEADAARVRRVQVRQALQIPRVQPKLSVGAPDDEFEREADQVADQVMRMPEPVVASGAAAPPRIQRKCKECNEEVQRAPAKEGLTVGPPDDAFEREADRVADQVMRMPDVSQHNVRVQRMCTECEEEERESVHRSAEPAANSRDVPQIPANVDSDIRALHRSGEPLPNSTRGFFEPRLGHDLRSVRIHTDERAAATAKALNARAFTLGPDIVFANREYAPETESGRRLLAHELTHVVQQQGAPPAGNARVTRKVAASYPTLKVKLSYSATDWAVTETEARDVLVALAALSALDQADTIAELKKDGLLERLIENIAPADRTAFSGLFGSLWNVNVPPMPSLATQADALGGEALTMRSYQEYQDKTWRWFFSPNDKLDGRASKPATFATWSDWDAMHWQSRAVIADIAGIDASRLARTSGNLATLQAAWASWPASKFAVFQSGTSATNTCNVFLGDSLFLDGKNQITDGKYYSAADVYGGAGAFTRIPVEALSRGDIVGWGPHVEIVTAVNVAADEFCSRGGFRPPIGADICGPKPKRQISNSSLRFFRVK